LQRLQKSGYAGTFEVLDREEVLSAEPMLSDDIAGGILAASERHVRPESFTAALIEHLRDLGAELREGERVVALEPAAGGWLMRCGAHELGARTVVLAGGAETAPLLRPLGISLPLEGAKGYSLTQHSSDLHLRRPIYLLDSKVAVSPFDGALRLAGTLELGTSGLGIDRRRVAGMESAARRSIRRWPSTADWTTWAGLRPMAPDGLPVIGPVPGHKNLHLATGHSMLGITLAPTTAEVLAPVILDGQLSPELAPFSISRFAKSGRAATQTPEEKT
jgi:D-amino-acid dehydrogenase